jgi:hypothetical protein
MKTTIYKVIQVINTLEQSERYNDYNQRIEELIGTECNILLFLDYQKAMDYAYDIAKPWIHLEKNLQREEYFFDNSYIKVVKDVLDFNSDILNSTLVKN